MPQSQDNDQPAANPNDLLKGRKIEDLNLNELQALADQVYEKLRRELILERDRLGTQRPWPGLPR